MPDPVVEVDQRMAVIEVRCPSCGAPHADTDRFCAHCGAPLPAVSDHTGVLPQVEDHTGEIPSLGEDPTEGMAAGDAVLLVRRGPDAGARYVLTGAPGSVVTAGRHDDSAMFLDDVTVSRRHVEFRRSQDGWHVVDLGSLNGTYVNRDRIEDVLLRDLDEVQVGKYRFIVRIAEGS